MTVTADIVVVGSGPAGISCCWPLVTAGRQVLLVDAGGGQGQVAQARPSLYEVRSGHAGKFEFLLGRDLRALRPAVHPSPKLHLGAAPNFVADYLAAQRLVLHNFVVAGTLATGGLSNVWGSVASAFDAADLAGMPLEPNDLGPSYHAVAARIGISGTSDDDLSDFHGDIPLQPPIDIGRLCGLLLERYRRRGGGKSGFKLGLSRNAVLSQPLAGRNACTRDAFCMWGCSQKSIYNSADELNALQKFANFSYAPGCFVEKIERTDDRFRISGRQQTTGAWIAHTGRRIVLATGTIASTRLVMTMLGRSGEQRRLLNNPGYIFAAVLPGQLGRDCERTAFAMAELSYVLPLGTDGDYTTGLVYNCEGVSPVDVAEQMPLSLRGALVLNRMLAPAMVLGLGYFDGIHSDNSICVEKGPDSPRVVIEGGWAPTFPAVLARTRRALTWAFARLGAVLVPGSFQKLVPGGESHYAGTLAMGDLLTTDCEVVGIEGVHVVDGAAFGRLPAKHFTFGIMANADRVGRHLAALRI
jgi:choline dehydrogenase-like flavoprotein